MGRQLRIEYPGAYYQGDIKVSELHGSQNKKCFVS
jgi:hypothetical protein